MPQLKGYVGTRAKPTATLALVTGRNEPLLAHWQYGLGRVAAWTSDARARWATDWLSWSDFPRFWSQMVRWTIAANEAGGLQIQTKVQGNRIYVQADALDADSQYLNNLDAKALVVSSSLSGTKEEITLKQTAPGHYEGYFTPRDTGSFIVNVQAGGKTGASADKPVNLTQTVGAVASYSPEYKQLGTNTALLEEIANLTGGKVLSDPLQAFRNDLSRTTRSQELWPWLLLLAILLFPLDIGIRRVNFSLRALKRGLNENKMEKELATTEIEAALPPSEVSRLFVAKQRVSRGRTGVGEPEKDKYPRPNAAGSNLTTGFNSVSEVIPGQKLETPVVKANAPRRSQEAEVLSEESNVGRLNTVLQRRSRPLSSAKGMVPTKGGGGSAER